MGPKLSRDTNLTESTHNINQSEHSGNFTGRNEGHRTSLTRFQSSTVKVDEAISAAETEALVTACLPLNNIFFIIINLFN